MKKLVVMSGKGGVGKSSITASLAISMRHPLVCADADVDASNLDLVLGDGEVISAHDVLASHVAHIDTQKCSRCKACLDTCYFNAIEWDEGPIIDETACEGCGACTIMCPALTLQPVKNATLTEREICGIPVVSAQLEVGGSGSGKIVSEVLGDAAKHSDKELMLVDAAAGVGCPVIAAARGADVALLVAEPTITSFNDLKRAYSLLSHFSVRSLLVINKADLDEDMATTIRSWAEGEGIEVVQSFPYDDAWADALVDRTPICQNPDFTDAFNQLASKLESILFEEQMSPVSHADSKTL